MADHPVILFDGVCTLCSRTVDFVIRRDPAGHIRFAAQQSPAGQALLARHGLPPDALAYLVLVEGDCVATRSTAVLRIGRRLGGGWAALAALGYVVPRPLRDALYDAVARRRYAWFGRRSACRVPTADERARFLDQPDTGTSAGAGRGS